MNKSIRFIVGLFTIIFIVAVGRLDILVFLSSTTGVLIKADKQFTVKKLSRSQVEYSYEAIDIQYKFEVDNRIYCSTRAFFEFDGWRNTVDTLKFLNSVQVNKRYTVWYDSRDPTKSWLHWSWTNLWWTFFTLLLGIGMVASAFLFKDRVGSIYD